MVGSLHSSGSGLVNTQKDHWRAANKSTICTCSLPACLWSTEGGRGSHWTPWPLKTRDQVCISYSEVIMFSCICASTRLPRFLGCIFLFYWISLNDWAFIQRGTLSNFEGHAQKISIRSFLYFGRWIGRGFICVTQKGSYISKRKDMLSCESPHLTTAYRHAQTLRERERDSLKVLFFCAKDTSINLMPVPLGGGSHWNCFQSLCFYWLHDLRAQRKIASIILNWRRTAALNDKLKWFALCYNVTYQYWQ